MDLELEPKALQYTISIRARGDVKVHFGGMRQPPFDTDAARRVAPPVVTGACRGSALGWPRMQEGPDSLAGIGALRCETDQAVGCASGSGASPSDEAPDGATTGSPTTSSLSIPSNVNSASEPSPVTSTRTI